MAAVLADAAALAGWQALDTGDLDQAWALHVTAQHAAREAEDRPALVHAMAQQAYVLLDVGRSIDALELARVAQDQASGGVPPVLEAWLSAVVGEMAAAVGDELGARRALDLAADVVPRMARTPTRSRTSRSTPPTCLGGAGTSWRGSATTTPLRT